MPSLRSICSLTLGPVVLLPFFGCARPPSPASTFESDDPSPRALLISIDGLPPDSYLHPDAHGLRIPTLRWLAAHGATSRGARSVFPSVTYPAHTSMVTGVEPSQHGIVANLAFDPLEIDYGGWRWYAEEIARPTLWQIAEQAGHPTALIYWPVSVGAKSRWLVPEFWRARSHHDPKLLRAVSTSGLLDQVATEYPDFWDRFVPRAMRDDALTDIAVHLLATAKPHLLLLHLVEVDTMQHQYGLWSREAIAAIENADRQLARIFDRLNRSHLAQRTRVAVVSDHGFMNAKTTVRPGVLLREAGLVSLASGKIAEWKATTVVSSGQAYVYLHDPNDRPTGDILTRLFKEKVVDPSSGIGRVYSRDEIRSKGGDANAFLALEASPSFQFESGCVGPYTLPTGYRATHGYDPDREEMLGSLLLFGPGIAHGSIENGRLIDLSPTIAGWLGLAFPKSAGVALRISPFALDAARADRP